MNPKTHIKKFLSLLLMISLVCTILPTEAFANEGTPFLLDSTPEASYATLNEAITAAADTDTVTVTADAEINEKVSIPAGKSITLTCAEGQGITLLRGRECTTSMFSVAAGASLTVNNLILDGNCGDIAPDFDSIAFLDAARANIPPVQGDNFSAIVGSGGIIYSEGTLALNKATLQNGAVKSGETWVSVIAGGCGGAVCVADGTLTVVDCTFDHNFAAKGGAICVNVKNMSDPMYMDSVSCTGSTFSNNYIYNDNLAVYCFGGAVFMSGVENMSFEDCAFLNNTVSNDSGGAISVIGINSVNASDGSVDYSKCAMLSVINCDFTGNAVGNDGFAINVTGRAKGDYTNCTFAENIGYSNTADNPSGEVSSVGVISLSMDGVAASKETDITQNITGCTFENNYGSLLGEHGYYILLNVKDTIFKNNYTNGEANNMFTLRHSKASFDNCQFLNNGGYIALPYTNETGFELNGSCDFVDCKFDGNSNSSMALVLIRKISSGDNYGYEVTASNCSFTGNAYPYGIIRAVDYADVTLNNCEIKNNTSSVENAATNGPSVITAGNSAAASPGISVAVNDCTITGNTGTSAATLPAIYVASNGANTPSLTISGGEISGNSAGTVGAIYAKNSTVTINGTKIFNNESMASHAGAIYAANNTTLKLGAGTEIYNNSALKKGGGLCIVSATVNMDATVKIHNNHAEVAGDDIYFASGTLHLPAVDNSNLQLDDCGHRMNGWYDDSEGTRWNTDDTDKDIHAVTVEPGTYTAALSLKAAHSKLPVSSMTYSTTFSYIEPWSLLFGAALKLDGEVIDTAQYTNYGAYILKTDDPIDAGTLTTEYMIENGKNYSRDTGKWDENYVFNGTKRIRLTYDEQLYTYQLDKHIYVMFYIEYDGQTYYGSIKDRQEKAILEAIVQNGSAGSTAFSAAEIKLVSKILDLYYATEEYLEAS